MSGDRRPWWAHGCSADMTPRDLANMRRANLYFGLFMGAWLVALAATALRLVDGAMVALPLLLLVAAAVPFYRAMGTFLRQSDELTRRIQLEAMAVGFGAAFFLVLLERIGFELVEMFGQDSWAEFITDVFNPMSWMIIAYFVARARLQRRYGG